MNRAIRLKAVNMAKARPKTPEILKRVREICLSLPETTEKEAWSTPTFRVTKKMFAMFVNNHHGDERVALWLDAPPGDQELLVAADPVRFFVPPYQGPFGWIGVRVDLDVDWDEVRELVVDAYRTSAPKTLLARLDAVAPVPAVETARKRRTKAK
jgi:hypothetical protein